MLYMHEFQLDPKPLATGAYGQVSHLHRKHAGSVYGLRGKDRAEAGADRAEAGASRDAAARGEGPALSLSAPCPAGLVAGA